MKMLMRVLLSMSIGSWLTVCAYAQGFNIPGIDQNILNAKTTSYSLAATDCGKTITLGGSAFYALTVGAASGFPATCSVIVANIDTGRGKTMTINGVTFPNGGILWPQQNFMLKSENNVWTIVNRPGRWKLTGSTTFQIDPAGANTNDGLATGSAAFQTIGGALAVVSTVVDAAQQPLILQAKCAGTTYSENVSLQNVVGAFVGGGLGSNNPALIGDTTTPANCVINGSGAPSLSVIGPMNDWVVRGFAFTNANNSCVLADANSWTRFGEVSFGSCNGSSGNHMTIEDNATVEMMANYAVTAGANAHTFVVNRGFFLNAGVQLTITGTPAFGQFALSIRNSYQQWIGATFVGSATGNKCSISLGGGIDTGGGGTSFLPGNVACTATGASFGWYNYLLKRDLNPANDNSPMWLSAAA